VNQDQVKELLLRLDGEVEEFSVIFSGKTSQKANGLYYPDRREIIIHNRNFEDDNSLLYTAIHEYAHHVHFTRSPVPVGPRPHTIEFRRVLHHLLERAEDLGIYRNIFHSNAEFIALTYRIRTRYLKKHGDIVKELAEALSEAEALCARYHTRFDDYLERVLRMEKRVANTIMRIREHDVPSELGYENMGQVANIRDPDRRKVAIEAFQAGKSADTVKHLVRHTDDDEEERDPADQLVKEKQRIQKTIDSLSKRLVVIDRRLEELGEVPLD